MARNRSLGSVTRYPPPREDWRVRWYDDTGHQRETSAPTEAQGRRIVLERMGKPAPSPTARMAWGEMAQEALDTLPSAVTGRKGGVTDSTRYGYRSILANHAASTEVWNMPAGKVTEVHLQAVVDRVMARGLTARTARTTGQVLRSIYTQAIRNKRVVTNPMDLVELPPLGRSTIQPLSLEETQDLLAHLEANQDRHLALYYLATGTGMRIGECLALRWADLTLEGPKPRVQVHATLVRGDYQPHTKTPHGTRPIPLITNVREALLRHRREVWGPERMAAGADWARGAEFEDYVFTRVPRYAGHAGRPGHASTYNRHLRAALAASGIEERRLARLVAAGVRAPERLRWHDLRHGFATHTLENGVPMVEVSRWLGHASERITSDIYYTWTEVAQDRMVSTLEAIGY